MESREKLDKDLNMQENPGADVAFEPYFDDNADMGVKISDDIPGADVEIKMEEEKKDSAEVVEEAATEAAVAEEIVSDNVEAVSADVPKKKKKKRPVDDKKGNKKPVKKRSDKPSESEEKAPLKKKKKRPVDKKEEKLAEAVTVSDVADGGVESVADMKVEAGTDSMMDATTDVTTAGVTEGTVAKDTPPKKKKRPEGAKKKKPSSDGSRPVGKKPAHKSADGKKTSSKSGTKSGSKSSAKRTSSKKKLKKGSLKAQLVALVALPILIVSIVLTINTATSLKTNIVETERDGLKTTAITLKSAFEGMAGSDTNYVERSSVIWQGEVKISGKDSIIDKIATNGGVQASFVFGDERILTSFKDADGKPMTQDGVNANNKIDNAIYQRVVVGGEEYFDTSAKMFGDTYYGYYLPLKNDEGKSSEETVGLIFIGRNSEEIDKVIASETVKAVVVCAVLATVSIVVAVILAGNISKMINRLAGSLAKISAGNLAVEFDRKTLASGNEIGQIGRAAEKLKDSLNDIVSNIKESVDVLTVSATNLEGTSDRTNTTMIEVSKAVEEIAESAGVQASETEKATVNAMDMGNLIENVIQNVEELQSNAKIMGDAEKASTEIIGELSKSNDRTIEAVERIAVQTEYTNVSAQKIKKAVALITSIADETSLLSLNASIEAARAGEAGRGFAVVASEISKLADQSNNSATEIEKIINELLVESNKTVDIMDEVKAIVSEQEEKLNMTKSEFANVSKGIESSVNSVENISGRIVELDIAKNGIIDVIQSLSAISEENAAATEETSASVQELDSTVGSLSEAAKDLKVIAEQLDQQISVFTV